jgi:hypothetical protein
VFHDANFLCSARQISHQRHIRFGSLADKCDAQANVRFGSKADMCSAPTHVRFTPESDRKSRHSRYRPQAPAWHELANCTVGASLGKGANDFRLTVAANIAVAGERRHDLIMPKVL